MPADPGYSDAVRAARARRAALSDSAAAKDRWFIQEVMKSVKHTQKQKLMAATNYLRDRIVKNISIPVTKVTGADGSVRVTQRSKPGEYPRADTTQLMKTLFSGVDERGPNKNIIQGFVGTPLDYGVNLEVKESLNRTYMRRTLKEEQKTLAAVFGQGPKAT